MKIPLTGGSKENRGAIANAASQLNLYSEPNDEDSPFPTTEYNCPGMHLIGDYSGALSGPVRGLYVSSTYNLYCVIGTTLLWITPPTWEAFPLGDMGVDTGYWVSMTDNGSFLFLVDNSFSGWTLDLGTHAFAPCTDPAFQGALKVDFVDTFFIFAKPNSATFYTSLSNDITFDPNYWANKVGYNDKLVTLACPHDTIWLFGAVSTEVWFDSGAPDFPFQRMPQSIIQQGCIAPWSVVVADNAVYWLSQDRHGRNLFMRGEGYASKRVSTFSVEDQWVNYPFVEDCIGMCYQDGGHEFIVLTFPSANTTWVFGTTTGMWHRQSTGGSLGNPGDCWPMSCLAYYNDGAANYIIGGDRNFPRLYIIDRGDYTDNGLPIYRERTFPHTMNEQKRLSHDQFVVHMQTTRGLLPDQVFLRWSDDGGQTWGANVPQTVNSASNGQYSWRRLGLARDRLYSIQWTAQGETALAGAWLEATPAGT